MSVLMFEDTEEVIRIRQSKKTENTMAKRKSKTTRTSLKTLDELH
jgi:hypothetical protein